MRNKILLFINYFMITTIILTHFAFLYKINRDNQINMILNIEIIKQTKGKWI